MRVIRETIGGGSYSTLLKYLQQWKTEISDASTADILISDNLRQALLSELGRASQSAKAKYEAELIEERKRINE